MNEMTIAWLVLFIAFLVIEFATMALTTIWFAGGSLAAFAYDNADIEAKVGQNECLVFLTKEHAELLENALFIAHTSLDVGFEDELGGGWVEEPENDGGLEEGQTITPLQNKIETKTYLTPEDMEQNQPVSKNVQQPNGPAWAQ